MGFHDQPLHQWGAYVPDQPMSPAKRDYWGGDMDNNGYGSSFGTAAREFHGIRPSAPPESSIDYMLRVVRPEPVIAPKPDPIAVIVPEQPWTDPDLWPGINALRPPKHQAGSFDDYYIPIPTPEPEIDYFSFLTKIRTLK